MARLYDTLAWRRARRAALARDQHRCTVAGLLGGDCAGHLDVHHIRPVGDGGSLYDLENLATACDAHHPAWEALRRSLLRAQDGPNDGPPRCRHRHQTAEARDLCNARLLRRWEREHVLA